MQAAVQSKLKPGTFDGFLKDCVSFVPEFYKSSNFLMLQIPDAFCDDGLGGRHFDPNCSVVAIRHAVMA
jgi:hypothetical protein